MAFGYDDFRAVDGCRIETRTFLESDTGRLLIRVLRHKYTPCDVPASADALVSARVLSQFHGAHACLDDIERAMLPPGQDIPLESTFSSLGTDHERLPEELHGGFKPAIVPTVIKEGDDNA
jgi:hypothetical protein